MRTIILTISALLTATVSWAQPLDLEQYKSKVLGYSQKVKQATESTFAAEQEVKAAKTALLPSLDAAADFNYMVKRINFSLGGGTLGFKPTNYSINATAAQNVYAGGAVRKQVEAMKINHSISGFGEQLTKENIVYAAEVSYWSVAAAIAFRDATQNYLDVVKETYDIVKKRFDDGLISMSDLLMVETRIREAEYQLSDVEKQYQQSAIALNILMGNSPTETVVISDSIMVGLPILPNAIPLDEALVKRPEYLIAGKTVELQEQMLKITRSKYLPSLAIGFTGQAGTNQINIDGSTIINGVAFAQLKVPIFHWNEKGHKTAVNKSNIRSSQYELEATVDQISQEISSSWSNLETSYNQLVTAKNSLDISEKSLALNTYSYNEGLLTILDVLSAQLSWIGSYNNLINTNYSCRVFLSDYKKATGSMNID